MICGRPDVTLDLIELSAGEKAFLSLQLPPGLIIIFDPVTHATQFIEAKGEPMHERQNLPMVIGRGLGPNEMLTPSEGGAVVKTVGDAVMATFPTPDRALAAALRMREAMDHLNAELGGQDLLLKIGIHEGPCRAVMLNNRQDYSGQTVIIASRVQHLARRKPSPLEGRS